MDGRGCWKAVRSDYQEVGRDSRSDQKRHAVRRHRSIDRQNAEAYGLGDQMRPIAGIQFQSHILDMSFDGSGSDADFDRDLFCRLSDCDKFQYLMLTSSKMRFRKKLVPLHGYSPLGALGADEQRPVACIDLECSYRCIFAISLHRHRDRFECGNRFARSRKNSLSTLCVENTVKFNLSVPRKIPTYFCYADLARGSLRF